MIEDSNLVIKRYVVCWKFVVKMAGAPAKGTLVTYFLSLLLSDNFLPNTVHGRNRLSVRLLEMSQSRHSSLSYEGGHPKRRK